MQISLAIPTIVGLRYQRNPHYSVVKDYFSRLSIRIQWGNPGSGEEYSTGAIYMRQFRLATRTIRRICIESLTTCSDFSCLVSPTFQSNVFFSGSADWKRSEIGGAAYDMGRIHGRLSSKITVINGTVSECVWVGCRCFGIPV
jgi:hypothetical protein